MCIVRIFVARGLFNFKNEFSQSELGRFGIDQPGSVSITIEQTRPRDNIEVKVLPCPRRYITDD